MLYDRPAGLCSLDTIGAVRHHSYHTLLSLTLRQIFTSTVSPGRTASGWRSGKKIGNQLNIPSDLVNGFVEIESSRNSLHSKYPASPWMTVAHFVLNCSVAKRSFSASDGSFAIGAWSNVKHACGSSMRYMRCMATTYGVSWFASRLPRSRPSSSRSLLDEIGTRYDVYDLGMHVPFSLSSRAHAELRHSGESSLSPNEPSSSETMRSAFTSALHSRMSVPTMVTSSHASPAAALAPRSDSSACGFFSMA
mmetsp:Transcript_12397/g.32797  ORF Transcript_12397/g.32797 Transcript_12397/m.32797 type:complete len:250 (+) Transcript_12397:1177-1926(+)